MPANPAIPAPLSYDEENAAKQDGSLVYALCDSRSVVLSLHAAPFTPPLGHSCSPVRWYGATGEWFDSPVEDPAPSIYAVIDEAYDRGDSLAAILSLVGTSDEALRAIHSRLGTAMSTLRSMRDERSQDPAPRDVPVTYCEDPSPATGDPIADHPVFAAFTPETRASIAASAPEGSATLAERELHRMRQDTLGHTGIPPVSLVPPGEDPGMIAPDRMRALGYDRGALIAECAAQHDCAPERVKILREEVFPVPFTEDGSATVQNHGPNIGEVEMSYRHPGMRDPYREGWIITPGIAHAVYGIYADGYFCLFAN